MTAPLKLQRQSKARMQIAERPDGREENPLQIKPLLLAWFREEQATASYKDNDAAQMPKVSRFSAVSKSAVMQAIFG